MKRLVLILGPFMLATVLLLQSAMAEGAGLQAAPRGNAATQRTGTLSANGNGTIKYEGSGTVRGDAYRGVRNDAYCTLVVRGAQQINVTQYASRTTLRDGSVRFTGVQGFFQAVGNRLSVSYEGRDISLIASGKGIVYLRGQGRYWLNNRLMGPWTPRPIMIGR